MRNAARTRVRVPTTGIHRRACSVGPASSGVDGPVTQQDDEPEAEAHAGALARTHPDRGSTMAHTPKHPSELFRTLAPDDEPPQRPRSRLVAGVLALLLVASVPLIVLAAMPGDPGVDGALAHAPE